MNPDTPNTPNIPILMITMQIPVQDDTNAEEVLEAIGPQLAEALEEIKRQANAPDPETIPQVDFNGSVLHETEETFSDYTHKDLLSALGYAA